MYIYIYIKICLHTLTYVYKRYICSNPQSLLSTPAFSFFAPRAARAPAVILGRFALICRKKSWIELAQSNFRKKIKSD